MERLRALRRPARCVDAAATLARRAPTPVASAATLPVLCDGRWPGPWRTRGETGAADAPAADAPAAAARPLPTAPPPLAWLSAVKTLERSPTLRAFNLGFPAVATAPFNVGGVLLACVCVDPAAVGGFGAHGASESRPGGDAIGDVWAGSPRKLSWLASRAAVTIPALALTIGDASGQASQPGAA